MLLMALVSLLAGTALQRLPAPAINENAVSRTAALLTLKTGDSTPILDYRTQLKQVNSWTSFPLRICFARDANDSPERERIAQEGFDAWVKATDGLVKYTLCEKPAQAQIIIRFDPSTDDGNTITRFWNHRLKSAEITLGVQRNAETDLKYTAAHEFGHALGLAGHSDSNSDLMYPFHWAGTPCRLTERDLNTLASLYPALEKARVAKQAL